ncbi:MAG: hypothetical protein PWQ06_1508, partial [Anaerophaga sp.]|nr:hypothetical protein [Anaerophaga sp.]
MIYQPIQKYFLCIFIFCTSITAVAQINNEFRYYYPEFETERANQLLFHVANINFVKDNEYKNQFAWGHTLIGYGIQPTFMYYAGDRLRLRAGVFLQQYSGLNHYSEVRPVLSAHLRLSPSVDVIMGSLRSHIHHNVIEPLFDYERQYVRPVENGLQVLFNCTQLQADVWIDWEQFIQEGDDIPEWFTSGFSGSYLLPDGVIPAWNISVPLNVIAVHRGGEVSDYDESVQTSLNIAGGLKAEHLSDRRFRNTGFFAYAIGYRNLNNVGPLGVNSGHAWYTGLTANSRRTNLMAGYFYGKDFVALRGGGIFQSVSPIRDNVYIPVRE